MGDFNSISPYSGGKKHSISSSGRTELETTEGTELKADIVRQELPNHVKL